MNETTGINSRPAVHAHLVQTDRELAGPTGASAPSRALVALSPAPAVAGVHTASSRPRAAFLAHVIATGLGVPQTRTRRRIEPQDASALYAAADRRRFDAGRILFRAI
jgi:hypothetical protein